LSKKAVGLFRQAEAAGLKQTGGLSIQKIVTAVPEHDMIEGKKPIKETSL
jgi:hypothetical protein